MISYEYINSMFFIKSFLIVFSLFFASIIFFDLYVRAQRYRGEHTDHFDGKRFYNYEHKTTPELQPRSLWQWLISFQWRNKNTWKQRRVIPTKPDSYVSGKELKVTFINHATVLIQTEGINILTDPVWAKQAGPFAFGGLRRYQDPGIQFEDLPAIDIVLLSHNHYDHFDIPTLKRLITAFKPTIYTHLGNARYLAKKGIRGAVDLDWWDSIVFSKDITIESVPAQHFSARAITDRNVTLWGGFVIKTSQGDIYYAGDTGYGPWVKKVKERYPEGFRLGILPIGAYKPEWFMKHVHIYPD